MSEKVVPSISKQKKILFSAILILIPFLLIAVFEIALRIFNYGTDLTLFEKSTEYPGYYEINKNISDRYFSVNKGPGPVNDIFLIDKPESSFRIFVMGGSTTRGFPYNAGTTFSRILNFRLKDVFPNRKIEVVNMSLTAVNSFTLADIIDEILDQKPDAILIYAGHNEFYGALGVASVENGGNQRWLKKLHLSLIHLKTYQLLQNFISRITQFAVKSNDQQQTSTRMELIVKNKSIEYGSDIYIKAITDFKVNLSEILGKAKKQNVPVMIGDLVSNIHDQKPFKSIESTIQLTADSAFSKAYDYELKGLYDSAHYYYYLAKDLDGVKFRAPEDINNTIYEVGEKYNAIIVPVKQYFEDLSPNKLIGNNLMLEHLHPNINGYFLLADAFFNSMRKNELISSQWDTSQIKPSSFYRTEWGFTKLDSLVAEIKIGALKASWPFKPENVVNNFLFEYRPVDHEDSLALNCNLYKNVYIENMHKELAKYYVAQGKYLNAFNEYNSLIRNYPNNIEYYINADRYANLAGEYQKGINLLHSFPNIDSSFILNIKIGKLYQKLKQPEKAIVSYAIARKISKKPDNKELLLTSLYSAYTEMGDSNNVSKVLSEIKSIKPDFNPKVDLKEKEAIVVGKEWKELVDRAILLAKSKNFDKALLLLYQAQQMKETPLGNQLIGTILFQQGKPDALKYILKAYKENPTDPDLLNNIIVLYIKQKDFKNAYKYVEELKLVTNEPGNVKKMEEYILKNLQ